METKALLEKFDLFLVERGLQFEAVAIGGAALNLLGIVSRYTRDCDILDPNIPEAIDEAARAFATLMRSRGDILNDDWLNNGPESLKKNLSDGWRSRLVSAFLGRAITLHTLGRPDLLKTKLFALCDRGTDQKDCLSLKPTNAELMEALAWVADQDVNPEWPKHVRTSFSELARKLGYEF